jgi:putative transcriptional regulator
MAITRMTLDQIRARGTSRDRARIDATTEEDIRRHMVEDGQDPDADVPADARRIPSAAQIRKRLGMTQEEFAAAIQVPLATLRNWEQRRVTPDPAACALLTVLEREPEAALRALARGPEPRVSAA